MEKGCILPPNLLEQLTKEDNVVLEMLARFCKTNKETLLNVLKMRNTPPNPKDHENYNTHYGYKVYSTSAGGTKAKDSGKEKKKKLRTIHEPVPELKAIQRKIGQRLGGIAISDFATLKPKSSAEKNAELHRYHPYLITLDLKDNYPSITTQRVYKNLEGALRHILDILTPHLQTEGNTQTRENKKLFLKALTHLCVSNNELPQGAPSSSPIQNIVMTQTDTAIDKKLPELSCSYLIYSRYADDITVSFPHYKTYEVLQEKFAYYTKEIKHFSSDPENLTKIMANFEQEVFHATDNFERNYITQQIENLKKLVNTCQISTEKKFAYIGQLNTYKKKITPSSRNIDNVKEEIMNVIGEQGRTINPKKIHVRTPQSDTNREVNGICFDKDGNKSLSKQLQGFYKRIFKDVLAMRKDELEYSGFYKEKFSTIREEEREFHYIDKQGKKQKTTRIRKRNEWDDNVVEEKIVNTLKGIYKRIEKVYGKSRIPKDFTELFEQAIKKWEQYDEREKEKTKQDKERAEREKKDKKNREEIMLGKGTNTEEITSEKETPSENTQDDDLPF